MREELLIFARKYHWNGKKLLLALSGGVDSMVLFTLLKECQRELKIDLHVAHVDHGWREESLEESAALAELTKGYPFYVHRVSPPSYGNLENEARDQRYSFFSKLIEEKELDGLILAHQKDDQTETVLKRILEGASLPFLGGMAEKEKKGKIHLFRPLLQISKKSIRSYAEKHKISFFEDYTNHDPKFLRARMRKKIIPQLEESFKKGISTPLERVASDSHLLRDYLQKRTELFWEIGKETPWGFYVDFSNCIVHELEIQFFLQTLGQRMNFSLGKEELKIIAKWIFEGVPDKKYSKKNLTFCCDRAHFLLHYKKLDLAPHLLTNDESRWGKWKITLVPEDRPVKGSSWKEWLEGSIQCKVPKTQYKIMLATAGLLVDGKSLFARYAKANIPSFFRPFMPVLVDTNNTILPLGLDKLKYENQETMVLNIKLD